MDDDRLLLSLRRIAEPVEPASAFLDDLYETLAEELGFRGGASTDSIPVTGVPATGWAGRAPRLAWLVAAAVLALLILAGAALVGALLDRRQPPAPPPFSDITSYRSDAQRTGVQSGPRPRGQPVEIWSAKADGPIQFNPVLDSGVLFVGSDGGRLAAFDGRSGSLRWSFDAGVAIKGSAVAEDGVVAVADANGILHVVDQATGLERWRASGINDVGNVSAGILYAPGRDNAVHGFDLQSGAPRWTWEAPEPVLYVTVVNDTAYVSAGGTIHAVAIDDGSERWSFDTQGTQASLASVAGDQLFISTRTVTGALTALDLATGSPMWTFPGPGGAIVSVGSIQDGTIYAPTGGEGFFALTARTGDVVWHVPDTGSILRSTPIVDGVVFAPVDDPGGILAIRATDGSVVWQHELGGPMQGWPIVSGGLIFTTDASGAIHAFGDAPLVGANRSEGPSGLVVSPPNTPAGEPSVPPNPSTVTSTLLPATSGLMGAADIDVGPDDNLYVVDYRPKVSVISQDGRLLRSWGRAGTGDGEFDFSAPNMGGAAQIAVGRDGLVYVSDGSNGRVQVFTPRGEYLRQLGNRGADNDRLELAWDLGIDNRGSIYVIDGRRAALSKFDSDGTFRWRVGGVGSSDPELKSIGHGVKFDPVGHVWIADDDGGRLIAIDSDGNQVDAFGETGSRPGQLAGPCGLNIDRSGNVFVYNCADGRIQVFDPDHGLIGLWDGPVDDRRQAFAFAADGTMYQLGPDDSILRIHIEFP